jgi:endonuclease/exonuclease/phosphatase family metal-dependent hydrolase
MKPSVKQFKLLLLLSVLIFITSVPSASLSATETIKVASFNIQVFGTAKASDPFIMDILSRTIAEFDIVAIQEIRDDSGSAIIDLENAVDSLGSDYDVILGPRLGRTTMKEQYAFIYRTSKINYFESYTYDDSSLDLFHREPFIGSFSLVGGNFDFVLVTVHTDPDEATEEIDSLPLVMEDVEAHFPGEQDIILLGDLNADGTYFDEEDMSIPLRDDEYIWLITNDMDTNVATSSRTYDRIIKTVDFDNNYSTSADVFRFDQVFNLTQAEAESVSDHYPVWAELASSIQSGSTSSTGSSSSSGDGGGGCFIETMGFGWSAQNWPN